MESHREIEILDLAARLRQLLLDSHPLAVTVNTNRLKLRFYVGRFSSHIYPGAPGLIFASLEDGVDPHTSRHPQRRLELDLKNFLAYTVMIMSGQPVAIKQIIWHLAQVAGGVHHDPSPDEKYRFLIEASRFFGIGGLPAGVRIVKAIGRVALRSLQPLIDDVRAR